MTIPARSRFPRWSHLRPPRSPRLLTAVEQREYQAIRIALFMTAGAFLTGTFVSGVEPIEGDYVEYSAWLRQNLAPLVRHCPTVAMLVRLVDLSGSITGWDNPRTLRRHLHLLAAEAERLGVAMQAARRGGHA